MLLQVLAVGMWRQSRKDNITVPTCTVYDRLSLLSANIYAGLNTCIPLWKLVFFGGEGFPPFFSVLFYNCPATNCVASCTYPKGCPTARSSSIDHGKNHHLRWHNIGGSKPRVQAVQTASRRRKHLTLSATISDTDTRHDQHRKQAILIH